MKMMPKTSIGLNEADYTVLRDFLIEKTGLNLRAGKHEDLVPLLMGRIADPSSPTAFRNYISELKAEGEGGEELRYLVSRLTVGETHFFRNRPQFDALRNHLLPNLIREKRGKGQHIRIWSAGCSTGEEAYSVAMLILDMLPDIQEWSISLLATDINKDALDAAREGEYRRWSFRDVDEHYRRRYFDGDGKTWRLRSEVRDLVDFRHLNLADDVYPAAVTKTDQLDLIICRNVMIYFTIDLSRRITERFFHCLREGGWLLVGHSEHSEMVSSQFRRQMVESAILYRREKTGHPWERSLKIRFRGSGKPDAALVRHEVSEVGRKKAAARPDDTEETVLFEEAVALSRTGEVEEAVAAFRRILAANPGNDRARYMVAKLLADAGEIVKAREEAERLVAVNPLNLNAIYLLALTARVAGDKAAELDYLKRSVYINRSFVLGHFQMGIYYLREEKERLAVRYFTNVLEILQDKKPTDGVDGVDGLSVGRLRQTIGELLPESEKSHGA